MSTTPATGALRPSNLPLISEKSGFTKVAGNFFNALSGVDSGKTLTEAQQQYSLRSAEYLWKALVEKQGVEKTFADFTAITLGADTNGDGQLTGTELKGFKNLLEIRCEFLGVAAFDNIPSSPTEVTQNKGGRLAAKLGNLDNEASKLIFEAVGDSFAHQFWGKHTQKFDSTGVSTAKLLADIVNYAETNFCGDEAAIKQSIKDQMNWFFKNSIDC